ncbi:MAG: hypothetical protein Q8K46_05185, partial [Deltaproteobacteria bacterium]|nr:hypothetical protein [Deltaproteobacteria bacterium]
FRREVIQQLPANQRRSVHFVNHLSPLIRWITKINHDRAHAFYDVSALLITHTELPVGDYCYRIERWNLTGLSNREMLAYGVRSLLDSRVYLADEAEVIIQHLLRHGADWDYVDCDRGKLIDANEALEEDLGIRFSAAVTDFDAENSTAYQIKVQRVQAFYDRQIAQHEQRLRTLREAGKDSRMIRPAEGRLKKAIENKEKRLSELKKKAQTDPTQAEVAAGIFRVTGA